MRYQVKGELEKSQWRKVKNAKRIQENETRRYVFRLMKGLNEDCTRQMKYIPDIKYTAKEEEAL